MSAYLTPTMQAAIGALVGLLMVAALLLLWQRSRSGWLLLALGGEAASLMFRLAFALAPSLLSSDSALLLVWQATALMVAAGLLGFALERPAHAS